MSDKLRIQIEGSDGKLDFTAFSKVVNNTIGLLRGINAQIVQSSPADLRWRVTSMSMKSPAVLEIEGVAGKKSAAPRVVIDDLISGLEMLDESASKPMHFSDDVLGKAKSLVSVLDFGVQSISFSSNGRTVTPTQHSAANVDALLSHGESYTTDTEIEGKLDTVSVHEGSEFVIYDGLTGRPTRCVFDQDDFDRVIELLGDRVYVYGSVRYSRKHEPLSMTVERFEKAPEQDELPAIEDLHRAGVNITGGDDPADFIRGLRDSD